MFIVWTENDILSATSSVPLIPLGLNSNRRETHKFALTSVGND